MLRSASRRFGDQRAFVRVDRVERRALDPVHRRVEPDRADDVRRSRLEPRRRIEIGRLLERDLVDHRSAALPRRHRCEQLGAAPQAADAGRAVELVRGESVEVGADGGDVDRQARHRLAAVEQQQRALRMRDVRGAPGVEDRAEHVRDMGEGDDAMLVGEHRLGRVEVDLPVGASAARRRLRSRRAATGRCCCDARAARAGRGCGRPSEASRATRLIASVAPRVKTSSFGWPPIRFDAAARARFVGVGHRRRALVHAAVHGRVIARIGLGDRVDHRLRLLRGRGAVEIMPAGRSPGTGRGRRAPS